MKCFSLISKKEEIHLNQKVIPAQEFSSLLEASELVQKAQEDAIAYQEEVKKECEKLKEEAQKAGFQEGVDKFAQALAACEKARQEAKAEIEKLIAPVAIQAAKKVIGREIELNSQTLVEIIQQSLKAVSQHRRFTLYVSKQDFALFEENRPKLKQGLEAVESLNIRTRDDIKPGDAVIETEAGIINVEMEQVWKSLERALS